MTKAVSSALVWSLLFAVVRDWTSLATPIRSTKVTAHEIFGRKMFVKRDDLQLSSPAGLSGNKARKMHYLTELTSPPRCLVSCGGAQSNSMLALAKLAEALGNQFVYFIQSGRGPPADDQESNFATSVKLGMQVEHVQ